MGRRARASLALVVACVGGTPLRGMAAETPVSLEWNAPRECPTGAAVVSEVTRIAGSAPGPRKRVDARAAIEKTERGAWRVTLATRAEGVQGRRVF